MASVLANLLALFGKAVPTVSDLSSFANRTSAWFNVGGYVGEPFTGAWQRNRDLRPETILAYSAVYSCMTLISSDVSKMNLRLVEQGPDEIWNPITSPSFSPVLRKPNRYQNRIKFIESWIISKLSTGNTIVLKERDARQVVVGLHILNWRFVKPLIAPDGEVYYELSPDNLTQIQEQVVVPSSEIIHDIYAPLFHPLCGVSPLIACGYAALQGLAIQGNSTKFFNNGAQPGGVLTAPGTIDDVTAKRLKEHWENNYSGSNAGKVAVLGDGLKFERMVMSSVESQLIEQLKWTGETVCSCFHVPPYMVGIGDTPSFNNIEALNQQYYSQCLQTLIECIELCLDEGLGLDTVPGKVYGTEFDLDGLLRMDTATQYKTIGDGIKAALVAPNEGRKKIGLKPLPGGDTVYMQEQNYSLADLNKRSQMANPFEAKTPAAPKPVTPPQPPQDPNIDGAAKSQLAAWAFRKAMEALPPIAA